MSTGAVIERAQTARDLLQGWRRVASRWPGTTWRILTRVQAAGNGGDGAPLVGLTFPGGRARALLIAGTHGDEPAGAHALLRFFASGQAAALQHVWRFDVLPLVNPLGYDHGTRGRDGCPDLNRSFGARPSCPESTAIARFLAETAGRRSWRSLAAGGGTAADETTRPLTPLWDLVLSLHEDPDEACLYLYDTGARERHAFAVALHQSVALLDSVERTGVPVCSGRYLDGDPNRGGLLIAAQSAFPALEPALFRNGAARRVVIVETPGSLALPRREQLHLMALRHFLGVPDAGDVGAIPPPR